MTKRSLSILVLAVFLALVVVQALAASPQGTRPDPTAVAWQRGIQATATTEDYTQRIQATATAEANYVSYHPTHTAATTDDSLIVRVIAEIRTNLLLYVFIFTAYILTYLCLARRCLQIIYLALLAALELAVALAATQKTPQGSLVASVFTEIRTHPLLYGSIYIVYIFTYLCLTSKGHTPDHTPTEEA